MEWSSKGFVASYLAPNSPPRLADHNHHEHKGVHDEDNDDDLFFFINLMMMVIISSWRDGGVEWLQSEKNMIQGSWQKISSSKLLKEEGGKKYIHFHWHWNLGSTILFLLKTRWLTSQSFPIPQIFALYRNGRSWPIKYKRRKLPIHTQLALIKTLCPAHPQLALVCDCFIKKS